MNELGRKSNLQDEEMRELKDLYDGERRKTMANEKSLSQLQYENKNLNNQIKDLQRDMQETQAFIEDL